MRLRRERTHRTSGRGARAGISRRASRCAPTDARHGQHGGPAGSRGAAPRAAGTDSQRHTDGQRQTVAPGGRGRTVEGPGRARHGLPAQHRTPRQAQRGRDPPGRDSGTRPGRRAQRPHGRGAGNRQAARAGRRRDARRAAGGRVRAARGAGGAAADGRRQAAFVHGAARRGCGGAEDTAAGPGEASPGGHEAARRVRRRARTAGRDRPPGRGRADVSGSGLAAEAGSYVVGGWSRSVSKKRASRGWAVSWSRSSSWPKRNTS